MNKLELRIKSYIEENGPITFDEFVEFALYDKDYGYYTKDSDKFGKSGDFYTSPAVHKAFGQVISNFIAIVHESTSENNFSVIELGSGTGYLALDILDSLKKYNPAIYENIDYLCIDSSESNIEKSKDLLLDHVQRVMWHEDFFGLQGKYNGVVLSNEFFDALPFHRIKFKDNKPWEIYVDTQGSNFVEQLGDISSAELKAVIDNLDMNFQENQQIEINLNYKKILKHITNILNEGVVLTFDYGYLKEELYSARRFEGTYRCFHNHKISTNPYTSIGEQDITSSVNFSELIDLGGKLVLDTVKYTTQGQFLVDWGILDITQELDEQQRRSVKNLFLPAAMGDMFKALIQEKNMKESIMKNYPESILKISYQTTEDQDLVQNKIKLANCI